MTNLWKETVEKLEDNGKTFDDVLAIRGHDFQITKDDFKKYSNTNYESGFGSPQVAEDLLVIGADFWLERQEYDGSEWWVFRQKPKDDSSEVWDFLKMPKYADFPFKNITALTIDQAHANGVNCDCGWENLADLQRTPQNDEVRE